MFRLFTVCTFLLVGIASWAQNTVSGVWYSPKTMEIFVITKGKTPQSIGKVYYAKQSDSFIEIPLISQSKTQNQNELMQAYYQAKIGTTTEPLDLTFTLSVAGEILTRRNAGKKADFGLLSNKVNEALIKTSSVRSYVVELLVNHKFAKETEKLTFKGTESNLKVMFKGKEADVKLSPNGQIISFDIAPWGAVKARLRVEGAWMLDITPASDDKKVISFVAED
ncbi:MAG: hypothetical protein MUC49_18070 [Raineya sp.]|jgi:hypothetical protein|nr:hypothetical protein [Raineya sp.]